jgi:hypothetical protein
MSTTTDLASTLPRALSDKPFAAADDETSSYPTQLQETTSELGVNQEAVPKLKVSESQQQEVQTEVQTERQSQSEESSSPNPSSDTFLISTSHQDNGDTTNPATPPHHHRSHSSSETDKSPHKSKNNQESSDTRRQYSLTKSSSEVGFTENNKHKKNNHDKLIKQHAEPKRHSSSRLFGSSVAGNLQAASIPVGNDASNNSNKNASSSRKVPLGTKSPSFPAPSATQHLKTLSQVFLSDILGKPQHQQQQPQASPNPIPHKKGKQEHDGVNSSVTSEKGAICNTHDIVIHTHAQVLKNQASNWK